MSFFGNWQAWLAEDDEPSQLQGQRRTIDKGLPCGLDALIREMEKAAKRTPRYRSQGWPKKQGVLPRHGQ